mmetsp:Transcript_10189/g.14411  ORF Transcript_10189/g.14411 Transcript_10189/m.14411 type:complete len:716 (-) Transcript_10189:173-2320(-)
MAAEIKMDELLVSWLGNDTVYENVMSLIESYKKAAEAAKQKENNDNLVTKGSAGGGEDSTVTAEKGGGSGALSVSSHEAEDNLSTANTTQHSSSTEGTGTVVIPPFYPTTTGGGGAAASPKSGESSITRRRRSIVPEYETGTWEPLEETTSSCETPKSKQQQEDIDSSSHAGDKDPGTSTAANDNDNNNKKKNDTQSSPCVRDQIYSIYEELGEGGVSSSGLSNSPVLGSALSGIDGDFEEEEPGSIPTSTSRSKLGGAASSEEQSKYLTADNFVRVTKEIFKFPSFFNRPLYSRIVQLWNLKNGITKPPENEDDVENENNETEEDNVITIDMIQWYWKKEIEPYDAHDRFFRLLKQPENEYIGRDDFLPYIKELLNEHPGLEFLSNHAEFQEKYAVTVITRIFYSVNRCHSGRITSRQLRRSDLLDAFKQVDEEEDINKVTRYFSYEHFYVLYCRFWELDTDRDYRITREDLLKYGDHSLSHMIVDRIFDAAPRPFECDSVTAEDGTKAIDRDYLSYEDFIFFMLSEEDKANEVSVRYWFSCVDVDGDGKLNNMEMRSFYAVQLHRMQCMGHEIVPFEDMLCQMMDMIKPQNPNYLVAEDFLQSECAQVSGALFDALFNLNKYLMFEQRDPFVERQKREDEFETDWDRFACIDYNRLAMEEEAREEEAMEIDWVTVDDEDEDSGEFSNSIGGGGGSNSGGSGSGSGGGSSEAPF